MARNAATASHERTPARVPPRVARRRSDAARRGILTLTACSLLVSAAAHAQEQGVSARDRQSAAQAYDRGTAAYLAEDFQTAAQWFETAHRLAPAAAALIQAVRSYERAGNTLRAATLGLRLQALYPNERAARRTADRALRHADRFVRVDVECENCTIQLDGAVMEHHAFFVEPGAEHVVEASFETGTQRETVRGAAGEQRTLRFEAPPAPVAPEPDEIATRDGEQAPQDDAVAAAGETAAGSGPVPLWMTIGAMAATAIVGGLLIWSGIDTLDGVPAYEANPTPEALADGQSREARTNWLIAGTSVLAATSLVLALFTDWGGAPSSSTGELQGSFGVHHDGAMASLRGRF